MIAETHFTAWWRRANIAMEACGLSPLSAVEAGRWYPRKFSLPVLVYVVAQVRKSGVEEGLPVIQMPDIPRAFL